jgi:hypothetical protein
MTKIELPARVAGSAPGIVAQAELCANSNEAVRCAIVTSLIGQSRSFWCGTDEEIFAAAGYRDANEYWHVATSEPMEALSFAHLLAIHLIDPREGLISEFDKRTVTRMSIDAALCQALKTGESWFIRDPHKPDGAPDNLNYFMLHPRPAAEWFLARPKRRHLIPPSFRAFLEPGKRERRHGPEPVVFRRVRDEMKKRCPEHLARMKVTEMQTVFTASPDTCRRARKEVTKK